MKKLRYNIYNNITDEQYVLVQDKLARLESEMTVISENTNWHTIPQILRHDGLFISFILNDSDFYGTFGITFEDKPNHATFSFSVVKSLDENNNRYVLRHCLFKDREFDFFENSIIKFVDEAVEIYNSWSKENIIYMGRKIELNNKV